MPLIEKDVVVTTKHGRMPAFAACPDGAGTYPGIILYGVKIVTDQPDSPHLLVGEIKGELFYGFAETDPSVPDNVIPDLTAALKKAGVKYTMKVYPKTQHGFCFPERAVYAAAQSEEVWTALFELWDRNLKPKR